MTDHVDSTEKGIIRQRCKRCRVDAVNKRRWKIKQAAILYKGGECAQCGYNKCIDALEFHHLDPTKKDFALGNKGHTRSWDKIKVELDKCMLVCSNCHKELHYNNDKIIFTDDELMFRKK